MGRIIRKIRDEQADCILIGPAWHKHWEAMLHTMPVRWAKELPHMQNLFTPGPHAKHRVARGQRAMAWYILW